MKNNKTLFLILLLPPLLTGCWYLPVKSTTPGEYSEFINTIESEYPSTQEDVIRQLDEPERIEKRGGSTYFIYGLEESHEYGVGFLVFVPFFVGRDTDKFCLFFKFDEANHLVEHASIDPRGSCILEFYRSTPDTSGFCRLANQGQANAQKYIGDLYYLTYYNYFEKNLVSAYVWYSRAANNGHKGAAEQVDILRRGLSPEQLSKAQIRLEAWKQGPAGSPNWSCH